MAQPYVGAGYGIHFPLHKGTEVVLTHEGGDPDRPIIVAALSDGERKSVVVGQNQTECILRSAGNNVLLFDDQKGSERWFAHAQKDLEIQVKNDAIESIGNDRHLMVKHDQIEQVTNDRHETIDRDLLQKITGKWNYTVQGNLASDVMGNLSSSVKGNVIHSYMGNHQEQTVGNYSLSSAMAIINAPMGITLQSGPSYIVINPTGVSINGPAIHLVGGALLLNTGPGLPPGVAVPLPAELPLLPITPKEAGNSETGGAGIASPEAVPTEGIMKKGKGGGSEKPGGSSAGGASTALAGTAAAAAATTASSKKKSEEAKEEGKQNWIGIRLKGKDGKPVPHESYRIKLPDGKELSGKLDEKGEARIEHFEAEQCHVTFPAIDKGRWRPC
jgi:type VI secretion system secreted protein VgrG